MAATRGTRFGPYEILSSLGEGGMGEVYRARDARLGRDVAIKILPASFAGDAERRARFEREAQTVASLSHTNVVAIHDTGVHDGQLYLVMELLEGETLRDRLRSGALPQRKAIEIAAQIARGLAAAHAKGLVHRDLKPENVFLLPDGHVKILDFGLARALGSGSGATETLPIVTDPGTVMGTVGYMAPEQVRGQTVDSRADLFALGAVLYEMLSGRRAFKRDTPAETMTAILNEDPPDASTIRSGLSPALDHIVRHALEKSPNERFQSARDVAFALESLSGSGASKAIEAVPSRRAWWKPVAAIAALASAAALGLWLGHRTSVASDVQYQIKTWDRQMIFNARFLPDTSTIVYSAAPSGTMPELFMLHPNRTAPERVGAPGMHLLAVSSTGELAVLTDAQFVAHRLFAGTLARLTPGSSPRPTLDHIREADWSPDGSTLAVVHDLGGQHDQLEYPTGTTLYSASGYLSDPRVSHDGRRVAFLEHSDRFDDRGRLKVVDTDKHVLTLSDEYVAIEGVAWSIDDEQLIFSAPDVRSPSASLQPHTVSSRGGAAPRVALPMPADALIVDVARDGRWLLMRDEERYGLVVKAPGDSIERDMSWQNLSSRGSLSDDGSLLAFSNQNVLEAPDYAVMLQKLDGSPPTRLGPGNIAVGAVSPDNHWVIAELHSTKQFVFYPTGPWAPKTLPENATGIGFTGWYPDSAHVLIVSTENGANRCYKQAISGGPPEVVGPEHPRFCAPTNEGDLVVGVGDQLLLYEKSGGTPRVIKDVRPEDGIATGAGGFLFTSTSLSNSAFRLDRINMRTGDRTLVANVSAGDLVGLIEAAPTSVVGTPGHYGYAYTYDRRLSTLVVASNVTVR
jgi:serine/threonine protein kinase/Tol biopolymer transport system component